MSIAKLREELAAGNIPIGAVIARANEIRLRLDQEALEFKQRMKMPAGYLASLTNVIHEWLNANGLQNAKGADGSLAFKQQQTSVSVADWDVAWADIVAKGAWQFLNHSVNKTEVINYVKEHGSPPPGVNYVVTELVQFRQPRKKGSTDGNEETSPEDGAQAEDEDGAQAQG